MTESPPKASQWMTYKAAGEQMGLQASAVAARARRGKWPKRIRNDTGEAETLVPGEALASGPISAPGTPTPASPAPSAPENIADALRAAIGPLQAMLERETLDRRTLQGQADALRDQLAAAQLEAAQASGAANTERAKREAADAKALDLQRQLDRLQAPRPRPWWRPW